MSDFKGGDVLTGEATGATVGAAIGALGGPVTSGLRATIGGVIGSLADLFSIGNCETHESKFMHSV